MFFGGDIRAGIRCELLIVFYAGLLAEEVGVHGEIFKSGVDKWIEVAGGKDFLDVVIRLEI